MKNVFVGLLAVAAFGLMGFAPTALEAGPPECSASDCEEIVEPGTCYVWEGECDGEPFEGMAPCSEFEGCPGTL